MSLLWLLGAEAGLDAGGVGSQHRPQAAAASPLLLSGTAEVERGEPGAGIGACRGRWPSVT